MEGSHFDKQNIPPEEALAIPEGVNEESIYFFLELLGRIAQDYGLDALTATPIELDRPDSLDDYIHQLEERIQISDRDAAEKRGALNLLSSIVEQTRVILEAVRNS